MRSLAPRVDSLLKSLEVAVPLAAFATALLGRIDWWDAFSASALVCLAMDVARRWRVVTSVVAVVIACVAIVVAASLLLPIVNEPSWLGWLFVGLLVAAFIAGEAWHRKAMATQSGDPSLD